MTQGLLRIATLLVLATGALSVPAFAEEAATAAPALAAPAPAQAEAPAPGCDPPADALPWRQPSVIETTGGSGCKASWICVHGGTVSCSHPTGRCSASGAGCGQVICAGAITRCPGYCVGDQHCYNFCGGSSSPNSFCDNGCCNCG